MESQGPTVTSLAIIFAAITVVAISLRLWARIFLVKKVGADDGLIVVAALLSWAFSIVTVVAVEHGLGDHMEDVLARGTQNMITYAQAVWLSSIFYNACLGFIKISVLALYARLGDRTLTRLAYIMLGVVGCQAGGNVLAAIFQCNPIRAAYDITIPAGEKKCINVNAFYLANAAVNIFTDLLTYTLPIKLVVRLQVPRRQKIGLAVILCLGLFACISSIVRITFVPRMLVDTDATFVISPAMYWSVIEINVGILAASIPSFKPIASRYMPKLLGSSYYGRGGSTTGAKKSGTGYGYGSGAFGGRSKGSRGLELHSVDRSNIAGGGSSSRKGKGEPAFNLGTMDTKIERGLGAENSSEEVLYDPNKGQINVRTQIETRFDDRP
ncbi:hypothetical protein PG994_006405 [Apiospora phragmitis]|uniref:Rhodopsin domain-containing protein n=1 Tax=Apiospora phragmitis TaxID=2905665 RepID=A0ABR1VEY5_9PEZI